MVWQKQKNMSSIITVNSVFHVYSVIYNISDEKLDKGIRSSLL